MIFSEIVILSFKSCAFATRVCDTRSLLLFLVCILLVVISVWKHLATFSNAKIREETFFKKNALWCGNCWFYLHRLVPSQISNLQNLNPN